MMKFFVKGWKSAYAQLPKVEGKDGIKMCKSILKKLKK